MRGGRFNEPLTDENMTGRGCQNSEENTPRQRQNQTLGHGQLNHNRSIPQKKVPNFQSQRLKNNLFCICVRRIQNTILFLVFYYFFLLTTVRIRSDFFISARTTAPNRPG
ncbi:hypothetical protein VZ95_18850 [Elstera litoralis]|uniref:Transmembrane protein n=1 Tax=Elstera litoralis TaxID=552518 RepID=A0A0F3IP01_9PROT|nr:hypothetical protein VZ95_18850 [Elstera litoralis]